MFQSRRPPAILSSKGAPKLPLNCGNSGMEVEMTESVLFRSYSTSQNNRFLINGPPTRKPTISRSKSGLGVGGSPLSSLWSAASAELRYWKKEEPWMSLVPLRVTTFTAPEEVRSVLGSNDD